MLLLFGEQFMAIGIIAMTGPLAFGLYLLHSGRSIEALVVLGVWTPIAALIARSHHRRRIARYPFVLGAMIVVLTLTALAVWAL